MLIYKSCSVLSKKEVRFFYSINDTNSAAPFFYSAAPFFYSTVFNMIILNIRKGNQSSLGRTPNLHLGKQLIYLFIYIFLPFCLLWRECSVKGRERVWTWECQTILMYYIVYKSICDCENGKKNKTKKNLHFGMKMEILSLMTLSVRSRLIDFGRLVTYTRRWTAFENGLL